MQRSHVWIAAVILSGVLAGLAGLPAVAWTDQGPGAEAEQSETDEKAAMAAAVKISIQDAMKAATGRVAGTVIEAELEKKPRVTWEVEVLKNDGTVVEVWVDVDSGAVVAVEEQKPVAKTDATKAQEPGR